MPDGRRADGGPFETLFPGLRLAALFLLLALLSFLPAPLLAQEEGAGEAAEPDSVEADAVVPQTFDWHLDVPNPATAAWGQAIDTAATRQMRAWTTAPEFTSPLVDHLPAAEGVLSPVEHFGYPLGRPGVLHTTSELYGWYEALAASTPRVRFQHLEETEEGRRFALVQVGSEENVARLEEIRAAYQALTDPRRTDEAAMEELVRDLPAVYMVFSGLHSPETGHPEVTAELAYRVAASDQPMIREIRDNAVLFIMPVTDPDGRDRVVEWYRLHAADVHDADDRPPGPPFWGKYVRHDNNRDGLQLTLALSRQVVSLFEQWKYPVGLDLHESVPFLYVSTGTGPYNPNIDPVTRHEWQWMAHHEVTQLTAHGMPGVWTHDFFDGWNPGYMVFALNNRNAIGRFYETFGNSVPHTMERSVGGGRTSEEWFRANPPSSEVVWSLRNNINYAQTGVLHSLHLVARNRAEVLRNYWRKNRNAVERGRKEAPHAWAIPAEQPRMADVAHMLELLRTHGVEVHRLDREFVAAATGAGEGDEPGAGGADADGDAGEEAGAREAAGAGAEAGASEEASSGDQASSGEGPAPLELRAGDYLIRADQPYGNLVRNLMEVQDFPEDAPRPYDDVAWTFPLLYNVTVHEVEDPAVFEAAMTPVTAPVTPTSRVRRADASSGEESAEPAWWVVRPEGSAHALEARWALGEETPIWTAREGLTSADGSDVVAGAWLIPGNALGPDAVEEWSARFGMEVLTAEETAVSAIERHAQTLPRIALVHTWRNTQDDGSVRYAFDTMRIPYTYLPADRLREGDLRSRFDVVIFPDQGRSASGRQIFEGMDPDDGPIAWKPHPEYPSIGRISSTPDMTGGMGYEGLSALRDFAEAGGTLLALGSAATLPIELGMLRGVSLRSPSGLFSPGSIVRGELANARHPIAFGYDERFPVFDRFGPYLSVDDDLEDRVVVRFAPADEVFLSGLVAGPGGLGGHPAVVDVPLGEGHVVLYGIRTLHRNQTRGSFSLVWNAILNWDRLEGVEDGGENITSDDGDGT